MSGPGRAVVRRDRRRRFLPGSFELDAVLDAVDRFCTLP
jgi:hypothetical protein